MRRPMRPRLLHLFNSFEVGGVERQHMMLVERLARDFGQACWSYCHGPLEAELDALGVPREVGGTETAAAMLARGDFDCVVMRTNRYLDEMCALLTRTGVPVVYMKDYLRWFDGNMAYVDPARDAVAAAAADAAFYCGPSLASGLEGFRGRLGGAELMYNGLDFSRFPLSPRGEPHGGCLRVGIMGNLTERKNQIAAVEALRQDLAAGTCSLELAGNPHEPRYAERLRRASEGLPVTLRGYVADPVGFLRDIDVFLMTSILEGWPVAIMEAMACGVPVIAPDVGDVRELLDGGRAGLVYPAGAYGEVAVLLQSLRDPALYGAMSRQGLARVRDFDIEIAWRQLDRAVRGLLAGVDARAS